MPAKVAGRARTRQDLRARHPQTGRDVRDVRTRHRRDRAQTSTRLRCLKLNRAPAQGQRDGVTKRRPVRRRSGRRREDSTIELPLQLARAHRHTELLPAQREVIAAAEREGRGQGQPGPNARSRHTPSRHHGYLPTESRREPPFVNLRHSVAAARSQGCAEQAHRLRRAREATLAQRGAEQRAHRRRAETELVGDFPAGGRRPRKSRGDSVNGSGPIGRKRARAFSRVRAVVSLLSGDTAFNGLGRNGTERAGRVEPLNFPQHRSQAHIVPKGFRSACG